MRPYCFLSWKCELLHFWNGESRSENRLSCLSWHFNYECSRNSSVFWKIVGFMMTHNLENGKNKQLPINRWLCHNKSVHGGRVSFQVSCEILKAPWNLSARSSFYTEMGKKHNKKIYCLKGCLCLSWFLDQLLENFFLTLFY